MARRAASDFKRAAKLAIRGDTTRNENRSGRVLFSCGERSADKIAHDGTLKTRDHVERCRRGDRPKRFRASFAAGQQFIPRFHFRREAADFAADGREQPS